MPIFSILSSSGQPKKRQEGSTQGQWHCRISSPRSAEPSDIHCAKQLPHTQPLSPPPLVILVNWSSGSTETPVQILGKALQQAYPAATSPSGVSLISADALTITIILSPSLTGTHWERHTAAGRCEKADRNILPLRKGCTQGQNLKNPKGYKIRH